MQHVKQALKAAFKKADKPLLDRCITEQRSPGLPDIRRIQHFPARRVIRASRAFNRLHHWQYDTLHPCFPLFLGLSLHIDVLTANASPFPLMGLVHTENTINQLLPLNAEDMEITCHFSDVRLHPRGIAIDVMLTVTQQDIVRQQITSTYLYRGASGVLKQTPESDGAYVSGPEKTFTATSVMNFDAAAGRRYARISGDYNPIHLYRWCARLFGFKHAIAHGTHVLARCISTLSDATATGQHAFSVTNAFRYPVLLPSEMRLNSNGEESIEGSKVSEVSFELRDKQAVRRKQVVLCGRIGAPLQHIPANP